MPMMLMTIRKPNAALPSVSGCYHANLYSSRRASVNYYCGISIANGRNRGRVLASLYRNVHVDQTCLGMIQLVECLPALVGTANQFVRW
jgi:hypothetical protein